MRKYIFALAAVSFALASCTKEESLVDNDVKDNVITTISVSTDNPTNAYVDGAKILWAKDDQISVLGKNGSEEAKNIAFTLDPSDAGTQFGDFSNADSDITSPKALIYPYQEGAAYDYENSTVSYTIPTIQTGVKDSFAKEAGIMFTTGSSLSSLKLGVNFLKVAIGSSERVHSITVSSPSSPLSGKMMVSPEGIAYPAPTGTVKSVTLVAPGEGPSTYFAPGYYYIAVAPYNAIQNPEINTPSVSFVTVDNDTHTAKEQIKKASGNLKFNTHKNVKEISISFTGTGYKFRTAVQLWPNGPYFATSDATEGGMGWEAAKNVWGTNWTLPSFSDFEALLDETKVERELTHNGSSFKFTGKTAGYTSNSFEIYSNIDNPARYWTNYKSASGAVTVAEMDVYYNTIKDGSTYTLTNEYHVRLILR